MIKFIHIKHVPGASLMRCMSTIDRSPLRNIPRLFAFGAAAFASTTSIAQITFSLTGEPSSSTVTFSWTLGDTLTTAANSILTTPNHSTIGEVGDFTARPEWTAIVDFNTSLLANNSIEYIGSDPAKGNGYLLRFDSNIGTTVGGSPIDLVGVFLDSDIGSPTVSDFGLIFDSAAAIGVATPIVFPSSSGSRTFTLPGSDTFSLFAIGNSTLNEPFPNVSISVSPVPEPSTYAAIAFGVLGLGLILKRRLGNSDQAIKSNQQ